jgi:hypothetical protein
MAQPSLNSLRRQFAGLVSSAHRQMGLRRVRDALALGERNPARVAELTAQAVYHLAYAVEIDRRAGFARSRQ